MQLYSPKRPVVDIAEVFLWLMAVGTILCASYWSAWSARETAVEQDKFLKVVSGFLSTGAHFLGVFLFVICVLVGLLSYLVFVGFF